MIHIAEMEYLSSVWTPFGLVGELYDDNELNALTSFGNFTGEHVQSLAGEGRDSQPVLYISVRLNYICSGTRYLGSLAWLQALHLKQTPALPTGWKTAWGRGANNV